MLNQLAAWFDSRTGYKAIVHEALDEPIPGGARWRYVFGSALSTTFMIQVATGLLLMLTYSPSASTAWGSVFYINTQMTLGWFIRGIHHFGSQAMIVLLALHLLQVLWAGAYRAPREVNWWFGMALLFVTLGFSLTGYLLPWDQLAIWAITVGSNMARATPILGVEGPGASAMKLNGVSLITSGSDAKFALLGGRSVGEMTLNRFYVLHCVAIPLAASLLIMIHFWRVRKDGGISGPM